VRKRFAVLTVDAGEADAPPMSTIWHDGRVVGEATSGGWGYRVGASIALAMLRADLAVAGTAVQVEIYGERRPAVVQGDGPLWDPENARLRA
jgi:dimethylglycine dehydrogenase